MRKPLLSVVMLTMRSRARLRAVTIPRLLEQMKPHSEDTELIVAVDADDSFGMDLATLIARSGVQWRAVRGRWSTVTDKQNAAITATTGEAVTLWDDDDWSWPTRLRDTIHVCERERTYLDLFGIRAILYHELTSPHRRTVKFVTPAHVVDGLVTFRRGLWTREPFFARHSTTGQVGDWIVHWVGRGAQALVADHPYVAMIHGDNATRAQPFRVDPASGTVYDGPKEFKLLGGREVAVDVMGDATLREFEEAVCPPT